jgi:hypothetical protein
MQGLETIAPAKAGEAGGEPAPSLDDSYCNMTALDETKRALLFGLLRGAAPGRPGDVRTFVQQSRIRASWYALTLPPKYLLALAGTRAEEMHRSALAEIDGLAEQALADMDDKSPDALPVVGGLTLSLALWSQGLRCSGETRRLFNEQRLAVVLGDGPSDAEVESPASVPPLERKTSDQEIAQLHSLVARTLELALRFAERTGASGMLQRDFLRCAIGCELVAISLAALVIGHRGLAAVMPDADASGDGLVRNVLDVAQRTIGLQGILPERLAERHPSASRSDHWRRLAERARHLLSLCGLLWDGFGVTAAAESLALRRFHLDSLFMADDVGQDVDPSLELARKTAPVGGPLGLLADLLLAANLRRSN